VGGKAEKKAGKKAEKRKKEDSQDLKDILAFGFDEAKVREVFASFGGDKEKTVDAMMQFA
jgi:hypothetical protein